MGSVVKCNECIEEHGLSPNRCGECRPKKEPIPLPSVDGCKGTCCKCIKDNDGKVDNVPCQQGKKK